MDILLMKEKRGDDDQYLTKLSQLGKVCFIPSLSITFVNQELLQSALLEKSHEYIIFTSANAVKAVQNLLIKNPDVSSTFLKHRKCYVVGKATEKLASELGFECFGSSTGNAQNLAKLIIQDNQHRTNDVKFLFPCGQLKRETLPNILCDEGYNVSCITVYETTEHPRILEEILHFKNMVSTKEVLAVFFSPSGVAFSLPKFRKVYGEALTGLHCAAIGETTAEALKKNDVEASCVATSPTADDLVTAISAYLLGFQTPS